MSSLPCWIFIACLGPVQDPAPPDQSGKKTKLWETIPTIGSDPAQSLLDFEKPTKPTDGEFFVAPIPMYNPTFGAGLTLAAGYIFPADRPGAKPSMVGGGVYYSDSGSWVAGAGVKLHIDEDRWRLNAGIGGGHLNLDFSGIGTTLGDEDRDIPLRIDAGGVQVEALRLFAENLYVGLRLRLGRVRTDLGDVDASGPIGSLISDQELVTDTGTLGPILEWDTRDSTFYPTTGTLANLRIDFQSENLGGDFEYQVYEAAINQYVPVTAEHTLALRGYGREARGDVPYYGLGYMGTNADLRGYPIGQYQDKLMLAVQGEWRWRFAERWVAVAFAGIGEVAPGFDDLSGDDLLPSLGAGLRYTIAPENKLNFRFDAALGKDDYAFYFGVGEAF